MRLILTSVAVCALFGGGWKGYAIFVRTRGPTVIADARRLLATGRAPEARQSLDRLLYFSPQDSEALLLKGLAQKQSNELDEARSTLQQIPENARAHRVAAFELALLALQTGDVDEAEVLLTRLVDRHPDFDQAAEELRWLYFNTFRQRTLEKFLEARLARRPGDVDTLRDLLMTEFRSPVPREGIGYLKQVDARRPNQPGVLRGLAWCHWQLGDLEQARREFEQLLENKPDSPEILFLALSYLIEQGETEAGLTMIARIEELRADGPIVLLEKDDRWWWIRSNLAEQSGSNEMALDLLNRALEIRPFELKYIHRRGLVHQKLGRTSEAATDFQRANLLESCATRLTEIVLSGALEQLTPKICLELSELAEKRGRQSQGAGWRLVRGRVPASRGSPSSSEGRRP